MTSQGNGDCRESVLSCLSRGDRAGRDRAYHSRPGSGARRPSIYDALHAGWRLGIAWRVGQTSKIRSEVSLESKKA
jgi:hypothetical protein